ncbi:MAG TPA: (d)CMP kinase [Longilinea sp.]|nr:(d)CMP kinase [Longilinea sp.]
MDEHLPSIIAIDGPAASGKSTVGVLLAKRLGYLYFDTGIMYRAVTWAALRQLNAVDDEPSVTKLAEEAQIDVQPPSKPDGRLADVLLDGTDITWEIRSHEVEASVSQVSAYPGVRMAMTAQQRRIGKRGRIVMVGRDIGTVVFPEAELKVYLDACVEIRAKRRFEELRQRGEHADYEKILAAMKRRDKIDTTREVAPLRAAEDAYRICSDDINAEQVVDQVLELARIRRR